MQAWLNGSYGFHFDDGAPQKADRPTFFMAVTGWQHGFDLLKWWFDEVLLGQPCSLQGVDFGLDKLRRPSS